MDSELDSRLQQIINRSSTQHSSNRHERPFSFLPAQTRGTEWSFGPGPRQPVEHQDEPMLLNEPAAERNNYTYELARQSLPPAASGPPRLSLAPRSIYSQQDQEPRALSHADHHFKFGQNLRHGLPMNQPASKANVLQAQSPLSQLATSMLLPEILRQPVNEPPTFFNAMHQDRVSQLQPRKQQITPPFTLSGYVYSPNMSKSPVASSPNNTINSSPTTRVSLRRATNRTVPQSEYAEREAGVATYSIPPETPQRQTMSFNRINPPMLRTLALGHAPPMAHGIQLVSPHELPDRFRQVFPYELFNAAQSKCFAPIYRSNDNVVVSAPTGSGKTALLELAICKLVEGHGSGEFKIVYQAPTKSLCSERMRDWQKKFSHLNLPCAELTGDTSQFEMTKVRNASIIVTTPEKWDSITRKWRDFSKLLQMVRLFLIDEVHILKDNRGATLEAVVSRMKSQGVSVRFVALSATVPNSQDIAIWLGKNPNEQDLPALRETFGEDFRPVKLQKHVHGFDGQMNDFAFEKVLDGKLPNLIQKYTHKKPIMVFCFTRKSCERTAAILAEWWTRQRPVDRAWPAPTQRTAVGSKELLQLVSCGVAFHHAGLDLADRHAIETAYLRGDISLICCTSTLAVGVNLPCHLVVLKGTTGFQDNGICEYSDLEVMQMLGRAGRPQFDDSAVAIIMTRSDKVDRYKMMISGHDILESTLHLNLIGHLNSEIGLGTIRDLESAKKWLMGTFLSVRMRQNPNYYKLDGVPSNRSADERLQLVCERDLKLLQDSELVNDQERFTCTEYGHAMSRYMVQFETMKLLLSLSRQAKTEEILLLLCQASEFKDIRMKPNERGVLRELNKSPFIKYPVKETLSTAAHKIFVMIQTQLGGVDLPTDKEFLNVKRQYSVDKSIIFERIQRLVRCIIDCKVVDCDAVSARHALDLARSLAAEFWEHSNLQLRQVSQIGPAATRKLTANNINSIEKLANLDTATVERIMGRNPPFGRKTLDLVTGFPRLTLASEIVGKLPPKSGSNPRVKVHAHMGYKNIKPPTWNGTKPSLTFIAETSDGKLVHFWRGNIQKLTQGEILKFDVELSGPGDVIKCQLACDEIVGTVVTFKLSHDLPASEFPIQKPAKPKLVPTAETSQEDEFGGDDIEDAELLAAVKSIEAEQAIHYDSDAFADIDELDDVFGPPASKQVRAEEVFEPVQMENGKWSCNHHCRGDQTLKNGQLCKHKCCREGLDKPRKFRRKPSKDTNELSTSANQLIGVERRAKKGSRASGANLRTIGPNPRTAGTILGFKKPEKPLKLSKGGISDADEVEVVDLAHEKPVQYADLVARDYRKLHNLHTKVLGDKVIRLPKQKPQFSYASGEKPDLQFLNTSKHQEDIFDVDSGLEGFPSPSRLMGNRSGTRKGNVAAYDDSAPLSPLYDDSMVSLEDAMIKMPDPAAVRRTPTPKFNSSSADQVFDFAACDGELEDQDLYSSPLMRETYKRVRSPSPEMPLVKHRRIKKVDTQNGELSSAQHKESPIRQELPDADASPQTLSDPSWVKDLDSDIIEGLRGFVDFVD